MSERNSEYTGIRLMFYPEDVLKRYTKHEVSRECAFNKRGECVDSVRICDRIDTECDLTLLLEQGYEDYMPVHVSPSVKHDVDVLVHTRLNDFCVDMLSLFNIEISWAYAWHTRDFHICDDDNSIYHGKLVPDKDHIHLVVFTSCKNADDKPIDLMAYAPRLCYALNVVTIGHEQLPFWEIANLPKADFVDTKLIPYLRNCLSLKYLNGAIKYLIHYGESDKYQYGIDDIISNFDVFSLSCFANEYRMNALDKIMDFIMENPAVTYRDAYLFARQHNLQAIFSKYQWQIKNNIESVACVMVGGDICE